MNQKNRNSVKPAFVLSFIVLFFVLAGLARAMDCNVMPGWAVACAQDEQSLCLNTTGCAHGGGPGSCYGGFNEYSCSTFKSDEACICGNNEIGSNCAWDSGSNTCEPGSCSPKELTDSCGAIGNEQDCDKHYIINNNNFSDGVSCGWDSGSCSAVYWKPCTPTPRSNYGVTTCPGTFVSHCSDYNSNCASYYQSVVLGNTFLCSPSAFTGRCEINLNSQCSSNNCKSDGSSCSGGVNECCSGSCNNGICGNGGGCSSDGSDCSDGGTCCSHNCNNGKCSSGGGCSNGGSNCNNNDECCSGSCSSGTCTDSNGGNSNPEMICYDGVDNNENGYTDCSDQTCASYFPACAGKCSNESMANSSELSISAPYDVNSDNATYDIMTPAMILNGTGINLPSKDGTAPMDAVYDTVGWLDVLPGDHGLVSIGFNQLNTSGTNSITVNSTKDINVMLLMADGLMTAYTTNTLPEVTAAFQTDPSHSAFVIAFATAYKSNGDGTYTPVPEVSNFFCGDANGNGIVNARDRCVFGKDEDNDGFCDASSSCPVNSINPFVGVCRENDKCPNNFNPIVPEATLEESSPVVLNVIATGLDTLFNTENGYDIASGANAPLYLVTITGGDSGDTNNQTILVGSNGIDFLMGMMGKQPSDFNGDQNYSLGGGIEFAYLFTGSNQQPVNLTCAEATDASFNYGILKNIMFVGQVSGGAYSEILGHTCARLVNNRSRMFDVQVNPDHPLDSAYSINVTEYKQGSCSCSAPLTGASNDCNANTVCASAPSISCSGQYGKCTPLTPLPLPSVATKKSYSMNLPAGKNAFRGSDAVLLEPGTNAKLWFFNAGDNGIGMMAANGISMALSQSPSGTFVTSGDLSGMNLSFAVTSKNNDGTPISCKDASDNNFVESDGPVGMYIVNIWGIGTVCVRNMDNKSQMWEITITRYDNKSMTIKTRKYNQADNYVSLGFGTYSNAALLPSSSNAYLWPMYWPDSPFKVTLHSLQGANSVANFVGKTSGLLTSGDVSAGMNVSFALNGQTMEAMNCSSATDSDFDESSGGDSPGAGFYDVLFGPGPVCMRNMDDHSQWWDITVTGYDTNGINFTALKYGEDPSSTASFSLPYSVNLGPKLSTCGARFQCGNDVDSDTVFDSDSVCTKPVAIAADSVTLDCDEYTATTNGVDDGIVISAENNVTVKNCAPHGNNYGVYLKNANGTKLDAMHLYGNAKDFVVNATDGQSHAFEATDLVIDGAAGDLSNAITLGIQDTTGGNEAYSIAWEPTPANLPESKSQQVGALINISAISGSPSIDTITFSWTADDVPVGISESDLALWEYHAGTWTKLGGVVDTANHRLTYSHLTPHSGFGMFGSPGSPHANGVVNINIEATNQISVYASDGNNAINFKNTTVPPAGLDLRSNNSADMNGSVTGFTIENQGNINVTLNVTSDMDAAGFVGGTANGGPLFDFWSIERDIGACDSPTPTDTALNTTPSSVCSGAGLDYVENQDKLYCYIHVFIPSDAPPGEKNATLTFTSTGVA